MYLTQIKALSLWEKIIKDLKVQKPIPAGKLKKAKLYYKNTQRGLARLREPVLSKQLYCIYGYEVTEIWLLSMIKDEKLWQG